MHPQFLGIRLTTLLLLVTGCVIAQGGWSLAAAEPNMTLKIATFQMAFPNGSSIVLPETGHGDIEIWLQDALAEIQVSSIRVRLNEVPMATFLTVNRLPRGVRVIVKLNASINADFSLRPGRENLVSFAASDTSSVSYQAQFYLSLSATATGPHLADRAPVRAPLREVAAPAQVFPPTVALKVDWPAKTTDRVLTLAAEIHDREGLKRVVIEVNSKAAEEVILENELPVRKQKGFIAKGKLPGTVHGDGRKLLISIPVTLDKRLNTVAVRAENLVGLTGYADRTVEVTSIR
jgi:hypothetical protein